MFDVLETIVLSVVLFIGIKAVSAQIRVDGPSMEPTLYNGEYILVSKLAYKLGQLQRGDIVIFRLPGNSKEYIKRVIGLPGDLIEVLDQKVYINGEQINELYITAPPEYRGRWIVPKSSIFALGDNRNISIDSHVWGSVPMENVIGKAILVYWPPNRWQVIKHTSTSMAP
jgi:signal peptidase I